MFNRRVNFAESVQQTCEFRQVFGVRAWSPDSRIGVCLRDRERSDSWFDVFRSFSDESSLGFFVHEIILREHFLTYDVFLPIRPTIYNQPLESANLVCSNQECRKHRLISPAQSLSPKVLICRIEG